MKRKNETNEQGKEKELNKQGRNKRTKGKYRKIKRFMSVKETALHDPTHN